MKRKITILVCLTIATFDFINAQTKCNHEKFISDFLDKITSAQYRPVMHDFNLFFDSESEIEVGQKMEYLKQHPEAKISWEEDANCLAIEKLLNEKVIVSLIQNKNSKKGKWTVVKSHEIGTATIVYKVGVSCSNEYVFFQMVNWPPERCGICDISDSNGFSFFFPDKKE